MPVRSATQLPAEFGRNLSSTFTCRTSGQKLPEVRDRQRSAAAAYICRTSSVAKKILCAPPLFIACSSVTATERHDSCKLYAFRPDWPVEGLLYSFNTSAHVCCTKKRDLTPMN